MFSSYFDVFYDQLLYRRMAIQKKKTRVNNDVSWTSTFSKITRKNHLKLKYFIYTGDIKYHANQGRAYIFRLLKQYFISLDFDANNIDPSSALERAMQHLQWTYKALRK